MGRLFLKQVQDKFVKRAGFRVTKQALFPFSTAISQKFSWEVFPGSPDWTENELQKPKQVVILSTSAQCKLREGSRLLVAMYKYKGRNTRMVLGEALLDNCI